MWIGLLTGSLFLLHCLFIGILILIPLKLTIQRFEGFLASIVCGLSLNLVMIYLAGLWQTKLNPLAIGIGMTLSAVLSLIWGAQSLWQRISKRSQASWQGSWREDWVVWIILLAWGALLAYPFYQIMIISETGVSSVVDFDLPVHVAMIQAFYQGESLPPQSPFYVGKPLVYPFAINFLSGILMHLGLPLTWSIKAPGWILCLIILGLLYGLTLRLTQSRSAANWSSVIFLCNGGIGLIYYLLELSLFHFDPMQTLFQPGRNYTDQPDYGLQWFSLVRYYLLPQRSSLLGLSLALVIALLVLSQQENHTSEHPRQKWSIWSLAGLLMGCLPLMHTHTFMALGMLLTLWTLFNRHRYWLGFWVSAAVLAVPQIIWMKTGQGDTSFLFKPLMGWHGWSANLPSPYFWLLNAGFLLVFLYVGLFKGQVPESLKRWTWASQFLFVMANLFHFAPYVGDNMKIFVIWYLFSVPMVSLMIVKSFARWKLLTVFCVIWMTGAGALDILKVSLTNTTRFNLFDYSAYKVAADIRWQIPVGTRVAHAPITSHFWYFTGRPSLLASSRYVESYGIGSKKREDDLKQIYTSTDCPAIKKILKSEYHDIRFWVWSKSEQDYYGVQTTCLSQFGRYIYSNDSYQVIRLDDKF